MPSRQSALADRFLAEGIAYCAEHDLASYGLYLRAWRARQAVNSGRWHAAGEEVSEVLAHPEASPPTQIVAHVVAGLLAARTGDHGRARGLLEQANAFAAPTGELQRLAPVAAARAEAGGRMLVCPICFNARKLSEEELIDNAQLGGATRCGNGSTKAPQFSATDPGPRLVEEPP